MNPYTSSTPKNVIGRIGLLLILLATFAANIAAQSAEIKTVSRLLEVRAGETEFARPRRLAAPDSEAVHPFSLEQATVIERIAFELTNEERIANGLLPLTWDSELCRLARQHSEDMGGRRYFDHETPEGLWPRDRARAAGLRGFRVIAENIAYNKGYENPGAYAVERWMKSSGHRANILYNSFQYSAIGSYVASDGSVYLTQVFISR
ncbi:MAG TPA: CAP domain-containing protein [Pyrinomonadaceae bacterium]